MPVHRIIANPGKFKERKKRDPKQPEALGFAAYGSEAADAVLANPNIKTFGPVRAGMGVGPVIPGLLNFVKNAQDESGGNTTVIHAEVNDFVRKDGHLVRVMKVDVSEGCYFTSDGGLIGFDEVEENNVFLESEVYDELDGHLPDAVDVSE